MPFTSEAPTCALDESSRLCLLRRREQQATSSHPTTSPATPGCHWLPIPSLRIITALRRVLSTARCLWPAAPTSFSNQVDVYDIASNSWSLEQQRHSCSFLLAGYQQIGQFLAPQWAASTQVPLTIATTWRLDMSSAPGVWDVGPVFTSNGQTSALPMTRNEQVGTRWRETCQMTVISSTRVTWLDELDLSGWPGETWNPSPPDMPTAPTARLTRPGSTETAMSGAVGGLDGATFQFLNEVWHRNNGGAVARLNGNTNRDGYGCYCNSYTYSYVDCDGNSYTYAATPLRRQQRHLHRRRPGLRQRQGRGPRRILGRRRKRMG